VLVVLIGILFLQQALGVARLLRSGRASVRFTWGSKPPNSPAPWLEPSEEAPAPDESAAESGSKAPGGWGFDRR
jgi:hypothetical protein